MSIAFSLAPEHPAWYVIHTRSLHEAKVEARLLQKNLEIFLPRVFKPSRRRDRKKLLHVPLFPGYLFVHINLEPSAYLDIITIRSVVRILGMEDRCVPVPYATVESIRTIVDQKRPYYCWPYLEQGKIVRIIDGPLAGVTGTVVRHRDKKRRLVVAIELFRRALAVDLEDEAVEPWS
jgi:transcriptional antiterminator NusG